MSEHPQQIVGPEGLRDHAAGAQISSVEKLSAQDREAIRREMAAEQIRVDTMVAAVRERLDSDITAAVQMREMEIARLEGLIANVAEVNRANVDRIQEVKNLHWAEHAATHEQEGQAVQIAVATIDTRLAGMNEFRQTLTDQALRFAPVTVVESEKVDTRRRFELVEAKLNQLEKEMGIELRKEVRPVQDAKIGQGAVIAAIGFAVMIILFAIGVANFMSSFGG